MVRRRFLVRDITEILEHWQAGRSICAILRSLGVCRATVRKYVYAAEARGYHQGDPTPSQGWKAFLPPASREAVTGFVSDFNSAMNRYFRAQALVASITGVLLTVGFLIIGVTLPWMKMVIQT